MFQSTQTFRNQIWILLLSFFLGTSISWAKKTDIKKPQPQPKEDVLVEDEPEEERTFEQKFIRSNIVISEWFDGMAEGLDLFLAGKKLTSQKNQTSVKLENSSYSSEGVPVTNLTSLSINPRFPNLEKYWMLKFTTYDERQESRGVNKGYLRQAPREQNYGATVGLFRKLGNVRFAFQPRIELQDPLKVSHSLAFESVADLKTYEVNPKLEFFASPTRGTGVFQAINVHFILTKEFTLTFINEGEYEEKSHNFTAANGFSLGQALSDRQALSYSLIYNSNNRPNFHMESYRVSISWYELIYKKILDYQFIPHLDFAAPNSFRAVAGATLHITLNF